MTGVAAAQWGGPTSGIERVSNGQKERCARQTVYNLRGERLEVRGERLEVRGERLEVRGERLEVRGKGLLIIGGKKYICK
jgi:hypothetical protein